MHGAIHHVSKSLTLNKAACLFVALLIASPADNRRWTRSDNCLLFHLREILIWEKNVENVSRCQCLAHCQTSKRNKEHMKVPVKQEKRSTLKPNWFTQVKEKKRNQIQLCHKFDASLTEQTPKSKQQVNSYLNRWIKQSSIWMSVGCGWEKRGIMEIAIEWEDRETDVDGCSPD